MINDPMQKSDPNWKVPRRESTPRCPALVSRSCTVLSWLVLDQLALGQPPELTNGISVLDLPTALRLAGARNLDIKIAREKLAEAKANHQSAILQFLPWVTPGLSYRAHDDLIQNV